MQCSFGFLFILIASEVFTAQVHGSHSHSHSTGLDPMSVQEGHCITLHHPAVVNLTWLNDTPRRWYFQFASPYFVFSVANALLGRQARNEDELNRMCLVDGYGPGAYGPMSRVFTGFGEAIYQKCALSCNDTVTDCLSTIGSINADPSIINAERIQIAMTDNESYLLMVSCLNGQYKNIQLVSPDKNLSPAIVRQAREKANHLEFHNLMNRLPCVGYAPEQQ